MHTITAVFRSLATGFIWFVAAVWILDVIGVNFGPLIAGAGIVGVALGFGTQTMVKDFIAGFFIVAEDQYGVGRHGRPRRRGEGHRRAGHPPRDPPARRRGHVWWTCPTASSRGWPTRARSGPGP